MLAGIQQYINTKRAAFVSRVAVILLLLYFAVLVDAGSHVSGDLAHGFHFPHSGYRLFPFPLSTVYLNAPVQIPLAPIEVFIYVVFIGQGIWIAWMSLGIIYIMMPLVRRVYSSLVLLI